MRPTRSRLLAVAPVLWAVALGAATGGCREQGPPPATAPAETASPYDNRYLAALAAANEFCRAWSRRDLATGKALLSERVRRTFTDAQMRDAVVGSGNPEHAGWELSDGRPLRDGRIAFRVRLLFRYAGQVENRIEAPVERIVLARQPGGKWAVDEFPLLAAEP